MFHEYIYCILYYQFVMSKIFLNVVSKQRKFDFDKVYTIYTWYAIIITSLHRFIKIQLVFSDRK